MTEAIDSQICELRLELNQQKQVNDASEVELMQREEAVIQLEAELQKFDSGHQSHKAMKPGKQENDSKFLEMEAELNRLKAQNEKDTDKINAQLDHQHTLEKLINEYKQAFHQKINALDLVTAECETTKRHLANVESAFSDVHQKYERAKQVLEGFRTNEEMLQHSLISSAEVAKKCEEKYDSLKAHAKAQIERSNKELLGYREKHQSEVTKLSTIIKRLEIKNASLVKVLDQKTTECAELAALCNEVTGRID